MNSALDANLALEICVLKLRRAFELGRKFTFLDLRPILRHFVIETRIWFSKSASEIFF